MKNKIELKKMIFISIIIMIIFNILFIIFYIYQYKTYTQNYNNKLDAILNEVIEKYPNVKKSELIEILNSDSTDKQSVLEQYGIDIEDDSAILENDSFFTNVLALNIVIFVVFFCLILITFLIYNHKKDKELNEITKYIEEINRGNYKLDIDDNTEDELSILKNEVYKTTIMLKEVAENSVKDKVNLKDSLSDISHQLKTPLTSIMIMLDNITEDKDMDPEIRDEFIRDIKREIVNIRFLVESLLKLSKIDSNTIKFVNKEEKVKDLIDEAMKKVAVLCDLKDIKINVYGGEENLICDIKWQVEAITNILKNCVEHSYSGESIDISYEKNNIYLEIRIKDKGVGISKKDLPHIFERFYKCENSSSEGVGIGLALSKSIIESNNGSIDVESELNKGTTFIIKYFTI